MWSVQLRLYPWRYIGKLLEAQEAAKGEQRDEFPPVSRYEKEDLP